MASDPKLTAGEKAKLVWLTARMAKRGIADDREYGGRVSQRDLERKFERVLEQARKREERDAQKNERK
ncbi:DUF6257 family protein [Streptomyces xantholiticus]|uniref:DUF6257 family protein n=1 Tax=Streptomyces xantholiticus TaxID=68285 RepID=A0ABV1V1Y5_9ACTN